MATSRQRIGSRLAGPSSRQAIEKCPPRQFPIQREIRNLENELDAFNERIAELESEGHRGHATNVLKANALDFSRRIDELRCVLVQSVRKIEPRGPNPSKS